MLSGDQENLLQDPQDLGYNMTSLRYKKVSMKQEQ